MKKFLTLAAAAAIIFSASSSFAAGATATKRGIAEDSKQALDLQQDPQHNANPDAQKYEAGSRKKTCTGC